MPAALNLDHLRVVLVSTRNPLNIGAAARVMSNFGFHHLRVVTPYELAFREAHSAVGASALLADAQEFATVAEAVADCSLVVGATAVGDRKPHHLVRPLESAAPLIRKRLASAPVALLFGSERVGLPNSALSHCHFLLRIPTRPEHRSLNLAQAVAISLYEIIRDSHRKPAPEKHSKATASELNRISEALFAALRDSGYIAARSESSSSEKIRRLVYRLQLTQADAQLLLAMTHQICWKLGTPIPARDRPQQKTSR